MRGQKRDIDIGGARRQHHGDWITGNDAHQDEDDEGHAEQRHNRRAEADQKVSAHLALIRTLRNGRRDKSTGALHLEN